MIEVYDHNIIHIDTVVTLFTVCVLKIDCVYCFSFQILECVTINLTFVYALFAHAHIKQTNLCTILVRTVNCKSSYYPYFSVVGISVSLGCFNS